MNKRMIINSDISLQDAIGFMRELYKDAKYFTALFNTAKKRTILQNAVTHRWYAQVSRELKEHTPEYIKWLCKYHFGLPILRADDPKFSAKIAKVIDPLPYEYRVEAMEYLPVTSLMNTEQLTEYAEHIQHNYAGRVVLEFN